MSIWEGREKSEEKLVGCYIIPHIFWSACALASTLKDSVFLICQLEVKCSGCQQGYIGKLKTWRGEERLKQKQR